MFKLTLKSSITSCLLISFLTFSCSETSTDPINGVDGLDGFNALVNIENEQAGDNCTSGGVKISVGQDANGNGTLEESEVASVSFVCNGSDGSQGSNGTDGFSLVARTSPENPGSNCESGGTLIEIGADLNGNNALDNDEVQTSYYVCNGADGSDGTNGTDGADGLTSLIRVSNDNTCANGGIKIEIGLDQNDNGQLDSDPNEVQSTYNICNGEDGADGTNGTDGLSTLVNVVTEAAGANCSNGGLLIQIGVDDNGDNSLSEGEVDATSYVCNGRDGEDGADGMDGVNGISSVMSISSFIDSQASCENGGLKVDVGMDDVTVNGVLDAEEIDYTYYICNGIDGADGSDGSDGSNGSNGLNTLVKTTEIDPDANCSNGGIRIEIGLDADQSGTLEPGEVIGSPVYVCNGQNGASGSDGTDGKSVVVSVNSNPRECSNGGIEIVLEYDEDGDGTGDTAIGSYAICNGVDGADGSDGVGLIIRESNEPAGINCPSGGTFVEIDKDINGNGLFDDGPIEVSFYVCDGSNGSNSLIDISTEPSGANCTYGGLRIDTGLDDDNDGILDPIEIDATSYVCDGADGSDGSDGLDGNSDNIFEFYFANGFNGYSDAIDVSIDNRGSNEYGALLSVNSNVETDSTHSILYFPFISTLIDNEVKGESFEIVEAILYLRAAVPSEKGSPPNTENWIGVKTLANDAPLVQDDKADWTTSDGSTEWTTPGAAETEPKGANQFSDMYRLPAGFYFNGTVPFLLNRTEITSWATNEDSNKGMVVVMLDRVNYEIDFYSSEYPTDKYFRPTLYIKVKTGTKGRYASESDEEYKARWNNLSYQDKLAPLSRRK